MVTMEEITGAAAVEALRIASEKLNQLRVTRACQLHGIGIGMFVQDKKGRKALVTSVKPWSDRKPWVYGKQVKADGSVGERLISLYSDWHVL